MSATTKRRARPLTMRDVHVTIGDTHILRGIDLSLHPGELCALIGPSGAGKSTLIKVLLDIRPPSQGRAALGGDPVSQAGPIGYVPQDDALHRTLSVRQALTYAALLRLPALSAAKRNGRIEALCKRVGLHERLDLKIAKLSGGQRKRVSVALELLTRPPVLILDEPTSGLDPGMEAKMMELFSEVAQTGRVVLVATHAMQSIDKCQALCVLHAGYLVWFGPPKDALEHFRVSHYEAIFPQLEKQKASAWAAHYRRSPWRARFVERRPATAVDSPSSPSSPSWEPTPGDTRNPEVPSGD